MFGTCEMKEGFLKSTFTSVIWVFLLAFSSRASFELQEMCSLPCPASPAAQSYQRNGKSVLKTRIQMPNLSILMWWSVGQVHKTDIWCFCCIWMSSLLLLSREFWFLSCGGQTVCSKRSERCPWSGGVGGLCARPQSVTRASRWGLWASMAFSADLAFLFPTAGFLWWFGAPHMHSDGHLGNE